MTPIIVTSKGTRAIHRPLEQELRCSVCVVLPRTLVLLFTCDNARRERNICYEKILMKDPLENAELLALQRPSTRDR